MQVTTFVRCPQTLMLDSLSAYAKAAVARDSVLQAMILARPACPASPEPILPGPTAWDHVHRWAPVAIFAVSVATFVAVMATRNKVTRVERIIERPIDEDH